MSKMKWLGIAVAGLLVVNLLMVSAILFKKEERNAGNGPMPGPPPLRQAPKEYIIEKLQLDEAQKAGFEKLVAKHRRSIILLEDEMTGIKNQLYGTLSGVAPAAQKDSLMSRLLAVQQQIETVHYNHFVEIRALCRPDQLPLYTALSKEFSSFFMPPKRPPHPPER